MQRSAIPYWDGDCPTVTELLQRPAQCAMVGALLCRATNPLENTLRAIAAWSQRHRDREREPKKSHLKNKNKCKHLYFRNSSYDEWEHKYQTMRTACLWWRKEWESLFFFSFFLLKKKLLSCIHCSTEYAHSISLMSYSYANVRHKLGSTSPCSTHRGMSYGTSSFMLLGKITNKKKENPTNQRLKGKKHNKDAKLRSPAPVMLTLH